MMRKALIFVFFILFALHGKAQNETYTEAEQKTLENFNNWFSENGIDWNELKSYFESYFQDGGIIDKNKSIEEQYLDILSYFERPTMGFPVFKEKKKVIAIRKKLNLSKKDIIAKKHLNCFNDIYSTLKTENDTTSSYYVFGATIETIIKIPDVSPGLVASAIRTQVQLSDFKKELYQKSIILLFIFDMTLFLND